MKKVKQRKQRRNKEKQQQERKRRNKESPTEKTNNRNRRSSWLDSFVLFNPIIPEATTKVLNALNIDSGLRNLSLLDGKSILANKIKIKKLDILFKKIT